MRDTATGIQYSSLSAGIANAVGTHQCQYFRTFSTFFEDCFRGLCCLVWLAGVLDVYPTALYSVIFLIFGDLIRGVDIFIKTILGCWGWRSFSCTSCSGRGGDSAVFRLASCAHIHSHCLVLLPLMSRFGKGKPGILRKDDFFPLPPTEVGWWYGHSAIFQMMAWSCEPLIVQC